MTYTDLEEIGFYTVAKDKNSFVSKTKEGNPWLEIFYSSDSEYLQIMRAVTGKKGETIRETLVEGKKLGIEVIKQIIS